MSNTRQHDLEQLRREWKTERDPNIRKQIEEAGRKISKESGVIRDMREALIKEHRKGNVENIKDIHEIVKKKDKYQNQKYG